MPPSAVVLLSGGLDSATVLAIARAEGLACHALSFNYGQRHRHELAAASVLAERLGAVRHLIMKVDASAFAGSALTSDVPVPKDRTDAAMTGGGERIPATYVPARNLVFLSFATAWAESIGAREVYIGVNALDYSGYPDCRPEFIEAFERTANLATKAGVEEREWSGHPFLRVRAPLLRMTKAQIIQAGTALGLDYSTTHSCYDPVMRETEALACARCDSCLLRAKGFREAGVLDPTQYA